MYSTWRVQELKDELKKRGASLRGKKADLVERLEMYNKNFDFGRPIVGDDDPKMKIPPLETYRDINSNTSLPPINKTQLRHYLCFTEKKFSKAMELYESRYLLAARSTVVGDLTYIKGYCRKTMKDLQYEVDIKIDKYGNPEESQCECPAGSGTSALCKHVAILLLGVEHMVRDKILLKHEACTQKLQQFHVPKKLYTGTPVRGENLKRKRKLSNVDFDPLQGQDINKLNYNHRIRNLVLNYHNSTMPIKQLYGPANPHAIENDHTYLSVNQKSKVLKDLKLLEVEDNTINEIEISTRGQTSSSDWYLYRKNRITASNFHTICHLRETTKKQYCYSIMNRENNIYTRAMSHGIINENIALKKYQEENGLDVQPCGLFVSKSRPYLGASPDGLLGPDTIIEVKCPYASRFQEINNITVPYLTVENNILQLKKTCPYYYQIQGQLYCTGRNYCNLIIYTHKDMKIIFINRDDRFISEMLRKLDDFYNNYFIKEIIFFFFFFCFNPQSVGYFYWMCCELFVATSAPSIESTTPCRKGATSAPTVTRYYAF